MQKVPNMIVLEGRRNRDCSLLIERERERKKERERERERETVWVK
jgi:hypothetical protein